MKKYLIWLYIDFILDTLDVIEERLKLFKQFILIVGNSKELKFTYSFLNIILLFLGLLHGVLALILLTLRGDFYLGVFAFLLMSTASVFFAFVNYKLAQ